MDLGLGKVQMVTDVQKAFSPLVVLLVILFTTTGQSQHVKVRTWYDSKRTLVHESFYALPKNSTVKDSLYISYYQNGNIQSKGNYLKNKQVGEWEYYYENGNLKMTGEMENNIPDGRWTYFYEFGGMSREGELRKGQKEGEWIYYFENGRQKMLGKYVRGKQEGLWKYFNEDGSFKAEAQFSDGKGTYKEYYPSLAIKSEGAISEGKSYGVWKYYYENGNIKAEGVEKNGVKEGVWKYYHINGKLASEGNYDNGKESGKWKYYHEEGTLSAEGDTKEGEKDGFWNFYYKDGGLKAEGNFKQGDGEYKEYFESGKLKIKGNINKGKNDGEWTYFYENGKLEGKCFFNEGKGYYKGYYENGKMKTEGMIEDGKRVGKWKLYKEDGQLAGFYKPFYSNEVSILPPPDSVEKDSTLLPGDSISLPGFKRPRKIPYPYRKRINEYKDFILGAQPAGLLKSHFGVSLEYYMQERLGFEFGAFFHRRPMFQSFQNLGDNQESIWGCSAYLRQKYYKKDKDKGMFYWAQELRYSYFNHHVNYVNGSERASLQVNENLFAVSVLVGDRLLREAKKRGWTLDIFGGLGVGYRYLHRNYTRDFNKDMQFRKLSTGSIFVPVRIGLTIGYLF